ncbi:MAG: hypothetical protein ACK4KV_05670 [Rhodocyclaceae bacterium]
MTLQKTAKAREAIDSRSPDLSARDRRVVILADGRRSRADLIGMLGADAQALLARLIDQGYLVETPDLAETDASPAPATPDDADRPTIGMPPVLSRLVRGHRPTDPPSPTPTPSPPVEPAKAEAPPSRGRRSLAATKLYMVDMLQLMRHPDASARAVDLHTSRAEQEVVDAVMAALCFIDERSGRDYALKVRAQLRITLPEAHLQRLEAVLPDDTPAAEAPTDGLPAPA